MTLTILDLESLSEPVQPVVGLLTTILMPTLAVSIVVRCIGHFTAPPAAVNGTPPSAGSSTSRNWTVSGVASPPPGARESGPGDRRSGSASKTATSESTSRST